MFSAMKRLPLPVVIILIFSAVRLLLHFYTNTFAGYGYFRDELYYIACSEHIDAGYVDHPPLSIFILWLNRLILGDSIFALRFLPAICSALVIFITGLITLKLKGGIPALIIALTSVLFTPIFMAMHSIYSMNSFDWVLWSLFFYTAINLFSSGEKKYWYVLGVIIGLGLLNKTGFLWLGAGLFAALILTKERRYFLTPYPYFAALIALILFLPYIVWNISHDFAHLEFIQNAVEHKYGALTPLDFISGQFLLQNPFAFPVWLMGIIYLIRSKETYLRIPGIIFLTAFIILLINGSSKAEYLSPTYPMLFAAGGAAIERLNFSKLVSRVIYGYTALILLTSIIFIPAVLPVLEVEEYISYSKSLGIEPQTSEGTELNDLPQHYADMFGWEELALEISQIYKSISEENRSKTFVFAQNYGEAAAIEFYSSTFELPKVFCPHNSYWIWGKEELNNFDYQYVIIIGGDIEDYSESLMRVEFIKTLSTKYAIPYEATAPIYLGRGFKVDVRELWERVKTYI